MAIECKMCKQSYDPQVSGYTYFCGRKCYDRHYYMINKEKRTEYFRQLHKKQYVPREKPPKRTEEEKKAIRKAYYESHKEYYKQKAHEHYLRHKDEPEYRRRHNEASLRYQRRRRLL